MSGSKRCETCRQCAPRYFNRGGSLDLAEFGILYDVYKCSECGCRYAKPVTCNGVVVSLGNARYCPKCEAEMARR